MGLAVRAGADQIDQGVFEGFIVFQKGLVGLLVRFGHKAAVIRQPAVQGLLFRLDFRHYLNHGSVVCRHDMGQRQPVDVHHGPADFLQLRLADHIVVHNGRRVGVDIINAEHRQQVGQQRYQSQQNHRQDEPLPQSELTFHQNSSPIHVDICRYRAVTPSTIRSSCS